MIIKIQDENDNYEFHQNWGTLCKARVFQTKGDGKS